MSKLGKIKIFQLSEKDIKKNSNLDEKDLGKWGFIHDGHYCGFFSSKEKVEKLITEIKDIF